MVGIVSEVQRHLLPGQHRYLLALSGGLDSVVLLHVLRTLKMNGGVTELRAMYVDHGLQTDSATWSQHCQRVCAQLEVPYLTQRVTVQSDSKGVEAAAREARYAVLAQVCEPDETLVTAHHRDDQVETLILNLMRGSGVRGLGGISFKRRVHGKMLLRPMLTVARDSIRGYAEKHQLNWIEDPSNQDTLYNRNFVRHEVMPLLWSRWPSVDSSLAKTASHCGDADELLSTLAQLDLERANQSNEWNNQQFCTTLGCRGRLFLKPIETCHRD